MKKITTFLISMLLIVSLSFSLVACGGNTNGENKVNTLNISDVIDNLDLTLGCTFGLRGSLSVTKANESIIDLDEISGTIKLKKELVDAESEEQQFNYIIDEINNITTDDNQKMESCFVRDDFVYLVDNYQNKDSSETPPIATKISVPDMQIYCAELDSAITDAIKAQNYAYFIDEENRTISIDLYSILKGELVELMKLVQTLGELDSATITDMLSKIEITQAELEELTNNITVDELYSNLYNDEEFLKVIADEFFNGKTEDVPKDFSSLLTYLSKLDNAIVKKVVEKISSTYSTDLENDKKSTVGELLYVVINDLILSSDITINDLAQEIGTYFGIQVKTWEDLSNYLYTFLIFVNGSLNLYDNKIELKLVIDENNKIESASLVADVTVSINKVEYSFSCNLQIVDVLYSAVNFETTENLESWCVAD